MPGPEKLPTAKDYSEATTQQVVKLETLQHPLTTWPAAVGVLGGASVMALLPASSLLAGMIFAGGVGFGGAVWLFNYLVNGDSYAQAYHQKLHQAFQDEMKKKLANLEKELVRFDQSQGIKQVQELPQKFESMREVLLHKLSKGEIAFSRFLGSTEAVYKSALDNLEQVVSLLIATQEVDINDLRSEIETIENTNSRSDHMEITLGHLQAREKMYTENLHHIGHLLARNEAALTMLDQATIEAAKIKSAEISSLGLDSAIMQLQRMAEQAQYLRGK